MTVVNLSGTRGIYSYICMHTHTNVRFPFFLFHSNDLPGPASEFDHPNQPQAVFIPHVRVFGQYEMPYYLTELDYS